MQLARLKEWRESRGLTQRELAAEAAVGHVTVARIETGASVTPPTARKIAETLGLSVADLMERPPVPLGEVAGHDLPNSIEELLERRNTKTRHLADPNLLEKKFWDDADEEDALRVARELSAELKAVGPDLARLVRWHSGNVAAMDIYTEASARHMIARYSLAERKGQGFVDAYEKLGEAGQALVA
jgi:transcriptional regulator with XRE-family HTH domain